MRVLSLCVFACVWTQWLDSPSTIAEIFSTHRHLPPKQRSSNSWKYVKYPNETVIKSIHTLDDIVYQNSFAFTPVQFTSLLRKHARTLQYKIPGSSWRVFSTRRRVFSTRRKVITVRRWQGLSYQSVIPEYSYSVKISSPQVALLIISSSTSSPQPQLLRDSGSARILQEQRFNTGGGRFGSAYAQVGYGGWWYD